MKFSGGNKLCRRSERIGGISFASRDISRRTARMFDAVAAIREVSETVAADARKARTAVREQPAAVRHFASAAVSSSDVLEE